jgi:transposase
LGLLLSVVVHPANIQDRDGTFHLLRRAQRLFPFIKRIFADGGYAGAKMALIVWRTGAWTLEIVKRTDTAGFEVLPKRWIIERTFPNATLSAVAISVRGIRSHRREGAPDIFFWPNVSPKINGKETIVSGPLW